MTKQLQFTLTNANLPVSALLFEDSGKPKQIAGRIGRTFYSTFHPTQNAVYNSTSRYTDDSDEFVFLGEVESLKNTETLISKATDETENKEYNQEHRYDSAKRHTALTVMGKSDSNGFSLVPYRNFDILYAAIKNNRVLLTSSDIEFSLSAIARHILEGKTTILLVEPKDYDKYHLIFKALANCAIYLASLGKRKQLYLQIANFNGDTPYLETIADLLFRLPKEDQTDILTALANSRTANHHQFKRLLDRILNESHTTNGKDLLSQEEQIGSFLALAKTRNTTKKEAVPDKLINIIKESPAYRDSLAKLKAAGFGVSQTQQFNVLQSVGYFGRKLDDNSFASGNPNILYNLSDMGAGKTLMTVQSIYVLDIARYLTYDKPAYVKDYHLPAKNLIAPKLSIKSSWLDTFKLFYDVKKLNDSTYELAAHYQGHKLISILHVASFTARTNAITVDNVLPKEFGKSYLIIDEIHQLVERKITARKFFERSIDPHNDYQTFILSGTLSDLTVHKWLNLIDFLGLNVFDDAGHNFNTLTPRDAGDSIDNATVKQSKELRNLAEHIESRQHRYFDPAALDGEQLEVKTPKMTNRDLYFATQFAPALINIDDPTNIRDSLIARRTQLAYNSNVLDAPNFKLFYQLVGSSAITAQSQQVAKELFGSVAKQHKSQIIKTKSNLTQDDLAILRTLHSLTLGYQVYKSSAIANKINNAILNLNDGLSTKSLYDVVNSAANTNTRFLKYLSNQNLNVLKKLPESNLIQQPKLEDTEKFHILQDLIKQEPDSTFLVVVNDTNAMKKLAKALNIDCFTTKQTTDALNYQEVLDQMFTKQNVVVVPQKMIKSSLDLVQANRLVQYQLNNDIADIIQTQNRINRIGQKRETKAYYIATDQLQAGVINLFLETYRNIKVAHKGIVELFVDITSQVNVVNDYITKALDNLNTTSANELDKSAKDDKVEKVENTKDSYLEPVVKDDEVLLFDPAQYETPVQTDTFIPAAKSFKVETKSSFNNELPLFDPAETAIMMNLTLV